MAEKTYEVLITRGVGIAGVGIQPSRNKDGKLDRKGPIVKLSGYDARAVISAGRGEYVDKRDAEGPMKAKGSGLVDRG